jgi:RNA polymerase sigma-70 factor (ECF subfamily)
LDRSVVERARHGDREAYELLARDVGRELYRVAYRILRDADGADDATQQALVTIWRELPKLRDPDRFAAWAYRIVVRFCTAEARRSQRWLPNLDVESAAPAVDDESVPVEVRDQLDRAFRRLSPDHRAVLVLHHYLGLSLGEIADVLGVPYGTVGSRLHYATRSMRLELDADEAPAPVGARA